MNEELLSLYQNINRYYPGAIQDSPADFANLYSQDPAAFKSFLESAETDFPKAFENYIPSQQVARKNNPGIFPDFGEPTYDDNLLTPPQKRTKDDIYNSAFPIPVSEIDQVKRSIAESKLQEAVQNNPQRPVTYHGERLKIASPISPDQKRKIEQESAIEAMSYFPISNWTPEQVSKAFNASRSEADNQAIDLATQSEQALQEEDPTDPIRQVTYHGERLTFGSQKPTLGVSYDNAARDIKHLLATTPMTTQDIMEADGIEGVSPERLLKMKDYLSLDDKLKSEKELYDLSIYSRVAKKRAEQVDPEVQQAYNDFYRLQEAAVQLENNGQEIPQGMYDALDAVKGVLENNSDQVTLIEDLSQASQSIQTRYNQLANKYPDLKLADDLNRQIQDAKDTKDAAKLSLGMKMGNALVGATSAGMLGLNADGEVIPSPVGRPVVEFIPKLLGRLSSTAEAESANSGDTGDMVRILRRSHARREQGTLRDNTASTRQPFERVSDFEYNGKKYTLGFDANNVPTEIYDETGNRAQIDPTLRENLMVEAMKNPAITGNIKRPVNSSALINSVQDVSADLLGTFALAFATQGLGTATAVERAREMGAIMMQYEGSFVEEGIRKGLSLDEAITYGRFKAVQEGGWEAAFPFISRITDGKVLKRTEDILTRILANGNKEAVKRLAKKEALKNIWGIGTEGLEEAGVDITDPFVNQLVNNYYNTELDENFQGIDNMLGDFALGAGVSIIPGLVGAVKTFDRVRDNKTFQESLFTAVNNIEDVRRVAKDFKIKGVEEVLPLIESTRAKTRPLMESKLPDATKARLVAYQFGVEKALADKEKATTDTEREEADKKIKEAEDAANKIANNPVEPPAPPVVNPELDQLNNTVSQITNAVQNPVSTAENGVNPLQDVESTANALENLKDSDTYGNLVGNIFNRKFGEDIHDKTINATESGNPRLVISEAYHKAKSDGSNPELVKAVEDLLGRPAQVQNISSEGTNSTQTGENVNQTQENLPSGNNPTPVDVNAPLETQVQNITNGTQVLQRFSPEEQSGLRAGGEHHVAATLIAGRGNIAGEEQDTRADRQESNVEQYARKKKIWFANPVAKLKKLYGKAFASGNESTVFYDPKRGVVIKTSNIEQYRDLQDALDGITAHNTIFPASKQTIVGFGQDSEGNFQIITEQPHIREGRRKSTENKATQKEIDTFMQSLGFEIDDSLGIEGRYKRGDIIANDITPKNVIRTPGGRIVPIDTIMHLNTEVWGGTRPEEFQQEAATEGNQVPSVQSREDIPPALDPKAQVTEAVKTFAENATVPVSAETIYNSNPAAYNQAGVTQGDIQTTLSSTRPDLWNPNDSGEGIPPPLASGDPVTPVAVTPPNTVETEAFNLLQEWSVFRSAAPEDIKTMVSYETMVSRGQIENTEEARNKYQQAVMKIANTQQSMADLLNQIQGMFADSGKTRDDFENFILSVLDTNLDSRAKQAILNEALDGLVNPILKPLFQKKRAELASVVSGTMNLMREAARTTWLSKQESDYIRSALINPGGVSGEEVTAAEEALNSANEEIGFTDADLIENESETEESLTEYIKGSQEALEKELAALQNESNEATKEQIEEAKDIKAVLNAALTQLDGENFTEELKKDMDEAEKKCL